MRILWCSNAPWVPTGYGTQTEIFSGRIRDLGHEVAIFAFYGLRGSTLYFNNMKVYPAIGDAWGNDVVAQHANDFDADLIVVLVDAWVVGRGYYDAPAALAMWAPVDHDPIPDGVVNALRGALIPISYSRFGFTQMRNAGLDPIYIPHGVPKDRFRPVDRHEARQRVFAGAVDDDVFVVSMVAANKGFPDRKGFREALTAWARFVRIHPKSLLYLHTNISTPGHGVDLVSFAGKLGLDPDTVRFCHQYYYMTGSFPDEFVNDIYNASDVLLNPARGEGFGLTPLEAQMAGCPTIVTDATSMPELSATGWLVRGEPELTLQQSFQFRPVVDDIVERLREALSHKNDPSIREKCREFAVQYDADRITQEYWKPALELIGAMIGA